MAEGGGQGSGPRFPRNFRGLEQVTGVTGEFKKIITQAVEIPEDQGFDEKLFLDLATTTKMMADLIDRFNGMLQRLVQEPEFGNVHYIDLRGTLTNSANYKDWWANELHPSEHDEQEESRPAVEHSRVGVLQGE